MMHAYLRWINKRKSERLRAGFVKQAQLVEPHSFRENTPEWFYYNEMEYRSDLLDRCIAHGIAIKGDIK